jgi:hypothetical protein
MLRRRRRFSAIVLSVATATPAMGQVFATDASAPGTAFNPGVRGQAAPATPINRSDYPTGVNGAYAVSDGSSIRGVAGGLEADTFNWKNRNYDPAAQYNYYGPRVGTLDYRGAARDHNADLYITANIRGLVRTNATDPANLTQEVLRHEHPDARVPRRRLGSLHEPHRARLPPGPDDHRPARQDDARLAAVELDRRRRQFRQAPADDRGGHAEGEILGDRQRAARRLEQQLQGHQQLRVTVGGRAYTFHADASAASTSWAFVAVVS